jgi:hypothetical protein
LTDAIKRQLASEIGDSAWLGDETMSQHNQLREALERSKKRRAYCQNQLQDFASSADPSDPRQKRTWQKLRDDLSQAESDVRSIRRQLDDLMD